MADLPLPRRIVTGHDADGKAIIEDDRTFTPIDPRMALQGKQEDQHPSISPFVGGGFSLLYRTDAFTAKIQGPWPELHGSLIPLATTTGTTLRAVDFPPNTPTPMHRTISLDFGIVVFGEIVLELDDDVEAVCKAGDVVVQRGTIHAWHNRTDQMARMIFVLLPSEKVVVNGEELEETKIDFLKMKL